MVDPYDVNTLAGQIYPVVGAGIGLSVLAGTSRMVMDTMYGNRYQTPRQRYTQRVYKPWSQQNKMSYHPRIARRMKPLPIKVWRPTRW